MTILDLETVLSCDVPRRFLNDLDEPVLRSDLSNSSTVEFLDFSSGVLCIYIL